VNEPTDLELAYLAGVVDSDGYIGVHRKQAEKWAANYQPRVQIKQVTPQAVDLAEECFGGHRYEGKPTTTNGRPLMVWQVHSAAAGRVCEALLPFLRIKRAQAENVLRLCEVNSRLGRRRFVLPDIVPGEELVSAEFAAAYTGFSYESVCQAVRKGSVPSTRHGRRILIPASYLATWKTRGTAPTRNPDLTAELDECFAAAKRLNRVGV
jgi:excisionase family DNA binding protein